MQNKPVVSPCIALNSVKMHYEPMKPDNMHVQHLFGKHVKPVEPVQHGLSLRHFLCEVELQAHYEPVELVRFHA